MFSGSKIVATAILTIMVSVFSVESAFARAEAVGVHDATCDELVALIDAGDDESLLIAASAVTWIEGYVSGLNAMNNDPIDLEPQGLDKESRTQVIVEICRANPDATMEEVAAAYYLTMIDYQEELTS